jgi:hypothetical protein
MNQINLNKFKMFKKEGKTKAIGSAQAGRIGKGDGIYMN